MLNYKDFAPTALGLAGFAARANGRKRFALGNTGGTNLRYFLTATINSGLVIALDNNNENMKTIRISDEVWNAIAAKGKFGETEDHVLRRVFEIEKPKHAVVIPEKIKNVGATEDNKSYGWKERRAEVAMYQKVEDGKLVLEFETGQRGEWILPSTDDSAGIRRVRDIAVDFVRKHGGTDGQVGAAMRALTSRGYHVTLKNKRNGEFA